MNGEIAVLYGSSTNRTFEVAQRIAELLEIPSGQVIDVADCHPDQLLTYDLTLLGIPTWDDGQPQADWRAFCDQLSDLDLSTTTLALFGLGDVDSYPHTYQDGMGIVADQLRACGARLIGRWPTDGYRFTASRAVEGNCFVGLALDEDSEEQFTEPRLQQWLAQITAEFAQA